MIRLFYLSLGLLLLTTGLTACQIEDPEALLQQLDQEGRLAPPEAAGQTDQPAGLAAENPLLRLLRFVPDEAQYREYLTYGDAAAWHTSWDVPRIDNMDELERLDREPNAYWKIIMPLQTIPPDSLGRQHLRSEDQRGFYGFDLFNLDRYIGAGQPPNWLTVVEFSFDEDQIAEALAAIGYEVQELESGGTLYRIQEDYQFDLNAPTTAGKLGNLNRIVLLNGQMLIAKATLVVTKALLANSDGLPSLADNRRYLAVVEALDAPALAGTGELIGVIFMESRPLLDPTLLLGGRASEEATRQLQAYAQERPLPPHFLTAFATRHTEGATYLILAVVFPPGTDAVAASETLAERLRSYTSLLTRAPLDERWTFDRSAGVKAHGLPVALVAMRVPDPSPTPEEAALVNAGVFSWAHMVFARDLLFLIAGQPVLE